MRAWIRLGLAAVVIVAAIIGVRLVGGNAILLEDVQAERAEDETAVVTMNIRNSGEPDRLISARSDDAEVSVVSSDADHLPIPAETTIGLTTEGAFLVLKDIRGSVEDGRLFPITLIFENAGEVQTKARFGKAMTDHGGMKHDVGTDDTDAADAMAMMEMDYVVPEGEPAPTLSISATPREGGGFTVWIETMNFAFSKEAADGPHEAGVGHGHLYVGGVKLGRVYGNSAEVPRLPAGKQIVRVRLNTNNHQTYVVDDEAVTATATVSEE